MATINGNNNPNNLVGVFDPLFPLLIDRPDIINGFGGNDTITALGTNDTLNGGAGRDTVNGGAGNDRVIDDDFVSFDVYNGGDGIDTIDYSGVSFAGTVTINLATGLTSVAGGNTETILNFENVEGSQGAETIVGSSLSNVLNGNGGNDTINGGAGNDVINGGTGNDILNGGTGRDTVNGGAGSDRVIDDDFVSFDVHNGGDGIDTIDYSGVSFAPGVTINLATGLTSVAGGNTETILNFENVEGSQGGETIVGSSLSNVLNGNGGNDTINGGAGNDIINGGTGNDSLIGGTGNDILTGGGDGQIDVLTSGSLFDRDTFVLGTGGISGSVLYDSAGNADFARITDFDLIDFVGEPATEVDRIQLRGTAADYRLVNSVVAGGFIGVGIYDRNATVSTTNDDLIALVQGVTAGAAFGQLSLTNTTQFVFV